MVTFNAILTKKKTLTEDVLLLSYNLQEIPSFEFKAGQYVILHCPQPNGTPARRLYSIASSATVQDSFELIAELIPNGVGSEYFKKQQVGDTVTFQGPAGLFTYRDIQNASIFLATGTGFAPMYSMLKTHTITRPTTLFWGVPYIKDTYYINELKKLAADNPLFTFYICLSREKDLKAVPEIDRDHYILGRVTKGLDSVQTYSNVSLSNYQLPSANYYICGGRDVVESLRNYLYEKNIPKEQVIFEKF